MGATTSNQFFENCESMNFHNIVDVNSVVRCARNIQGKSSNSASPSDLLFFNFPENSTYNGEEINGGFQKVFISNYSQLLEMHRDEISNLNIVDVNKIERYTNALLYEYYVYIEKVRQITEKNVNPHFIKVLGGAQSASYENIRNFIINHVNPEVRVLLQTNINPNEGIIQDQLKTNFVDNFIYMIHNIRNRPSLTKTNGASSLINNARYFNAGQPLPLYNNILNFIDQVRYSFILTERVIMYHEVDTLDDFYNIPVGESITLDNFLSVLDNTQNYGSNEEIIKASEFSYFFYFQIISACYAMFLSGVNHNDLHAGNILIKRVENIVNEYFINGIRYRIFTDFSAMIYDFDRAYTSDFMEHYDNEIHTGSPNELLKNTIHPLKDIVKVLFYFLNRADHILRQDIIQDIANVGQENNVDAFFRTQPNQWIEQRVTKEQLDTLFEHPVVILRNLFNRFSGANENHLSNNPNLNVYTYICDRDTFNLGVLDSQTQITHFAEDLSELCQDSELLLNQQIQNLENDNDNLRAERDMLHNIRDELFLQNQTLQQEINILRRNN